MRAPKPYMSAFSWSFTSFSAYKHAISVSRHIHRCSVRQYAALHNPFAFQTSRVSKSVADALREAFPNIRDPTATQAEFIPAVLSGKDVLLKDKTGSGKSLGLLVALLGKPRHSPKYGNYGRSGHKPCISSIVITPHRDLAFQYLHWANCMYATGKFEEGNLDQVIQVLVRGASTPIVEQVQKAVTTPPKTLVATPQALLEALSLAKPQLNLREMKTVVVDEADYMLESIPAKKDKYSLLKFARMVKNHPTPTRQILDAVYRIRRKGEWRKPRTGEIAPNEAESSLVEPRNGIRLECLPAARPQLVFASATLTAQFRHSLYVDGQWLSKDEGQQVKVVYHEKASKEDAAIHVLGGQSIVHSALVVTKAGEIFNINGAAEPLPSPSVPMPTPALEGSSVTDEEVLLDDVPLPVNEREYKGPSPFNAAALEAIATVFALEVPRVALLVLHPSAPVERAVHEMRALGANARGLDVLDRDRGGSYLLKKGTVPEDTPTLLVSTLAAIRGLDLPDLTHVFIMGVRAMDALSQDAYAHAAGRVGRFGKSGKVITVIENPYAKRDGAKTVTVNEPMRLKQVYQRLRVTPVQVEHFPTFGGTDDKTSLREASGQEGPENAD